MEIIRYTVWVLNDEDVDITEWELGQEDEMKRFVEAHADAMIIPIVKVEIV